MDSYFLYDFELSEPLLLYPLFPDDSIILAAEAAHVAPTPTIAAFVAATAATPLPSIPPPTSANAPPPRPPVPAVSIPTATIKATIAMPVSISLNFGK